MICIDPQYVDGCSVAEKQSAKRFMEDIGYALSAQNQRHYRFFWKALWEMREAGVDRILLYRTKDFDSFCRSYSRKSVISLVDLMVTWETQFRPHIEQLETRVARLRNGDTNRNFYLDDPLVTNQLSIRATAWNKSFSFKTELVLYPKNDWGLYLVLRQRLELAETSHSSSSSCQDTMALYQSVRLFH
jgi:hypothetical protein